MKITDMPGMTPSEVVAARSEAFIRGDFGLIFDSYHPESNFRRQFVDRQEYIAYGRDSLGQDYRIIECQVIAEEVGQDESRVVYLMAMEVQGTLQSYAELAWFRQAGEEWRYHRGQKMSGDELPSNPERLVFSDFDRLDPATIF